MYFNIEINILD